jgi:hypothetical protein
MTRCNRCSTVIRRNVGQPDPSGTELLQRLGNKLRTIIHTQHPRWSAGRGKHVLQLGDEPLGVIERSNRCSSDARVCSSIIDAILIALPSIVESNWKSIAHNTFGARRQLPVAPTTPPHGRHQPLQNVTVLPPGRSPTIDPTRTLAIRPRLSR